jgi:ABC-type lipoprotein export system ATPase subunit
VLINVREAWKSYHLGEVEIPAVCGVSLSIPPGQFVAVIGPSGSGKSTFMNLLGCLDPLDAGSYLFEGRPIERLSRSRLAALRSRRIGFVFQSFNLLSRTTIVDNVALPLMYQGVRRGERRRRAAEMLERVGLTERLRHHPNQLSGGPQQHPGDARGGHRRVHPAPRHVPRRPHRDRHDGGGARGGVALPAARARLALATLCESMRNR